MKTNFAAVAALTLAAALAACQKPADTADGKPSRAEAAFGQSVRAYLLEHPEVIEEAVAKLQEKKQAEAATQAATAEADARKLIPHYRAELERDPRDFVANPDGKITVVEFFDYNCGYCKLAAPEVLKLIEENPDVRFVFKEFPIFGEASDTPEIARQVAEIRSLAANLKVQGTPAFVVGDTMIPGADIGALKAAIAQAKAGELKQPAAG